MPSSIITLTNEAPGGLHPEAETAKRISTPAPRTVAGATHVGWSGTSGNIAPSNDPQAARSTALRIAIVTETFAPEINGVAMTLKRLAQGLRSRGHALQLISPQHPGRGRFVTALGATWLSVAGLPLPGYSALRFGLPARRRVRRLWQAARPDVVYVATQGPLGWAAAREARRQGIPVVSGFHTNFHVYTRHYKLSWLENTVTAYLRRFHNQTAGTLVPTVAQQSDLQRLGFRNVDVLQRGVDSALYHPRRRDALLRAGWGVCKDDLAVIYVGRIAAEKNLALAVRAFRAIQKSCPGARFVLVGDGPLAGELWEENPDFIFCGAQCGLNLAQHYASGDLFLFPSLTETFGNVVLEAMASGLALVAYNRAAARVCVQHRENGWLVEPGDEAAFIEGAVALATDHALRANIRRAARVCAEAWAWPQVVDNFEQWLRRHTKQ